MAIESDLLKLKVHEANTELKLIDAKNMHEIAKVALNKSIGVDINKDTKVGYSNSSISTDNESFDSVVSTMFFHHVQLVDGVNGFIHVFLYRFNC